MKNWQAQVAEKKQREAKVMAGYRKVRSEDEAAEHVMAGDAKMCHNGSLRDVTAYNRETGWAVTYPAGNHDRWSRRSFMVVARRDIYVPCQ